MGTFAMDRRECKLSRHELSLLNDRRVGELINAINNNHFTKDGRMHRTKVDCPFPLQTHINSTQLSCIQSLSSGLGFSADPLGV
jgi:hypothetical protein